MVELIHSKNEIRIRLEFMPIFVLKDTIELKRLSGNIV